MDQTQLPSTIEGQIIFENNRARGDENERLIGYLVTQRFVRLTDRDGGWTTLYRDPVDGGYWEESHPKAYMHGGGPLRLDRLTEGQVLERYGSLPDKSSEDV